MFKYSPSPPPPSIIVHPPPINPHPHHHHPYPLTPPPTTTHQALKTTTPQPPPQTTNHHPSAPPPPFHPPPTTHVISEASEPHFIAHPREHAPLSSATGVHLNVRITLTFLTLSPLLSPVPVIRLPHLPQPPSEW